MLDMQTVWGLLVLPFLLCDAPCTAWFFLKG